ncbi:transposase [Mycoplasmopsis caviae]|uniref:Transposase n=1 Tax=Mycoplasmopsis caviae TaxID=55603 RepID=A0A3P8KN35_9BACT|nr:transposase [Mycoplasmopsis caviae]VDR42268.1 Transposase [Mycoplasmopsis caviae]
MAIPKEILSIERPKGTIVRNSFGIYSVVKRSSKYVNGKAIPYNIAVIGRIENGKYIALKEPKYMKNNKKVVTTIKDYGNVAIFQKHGKNIYEQSQKHFDELTAKKIYLISLIRCAYPKATNRDLKFYYETSFLSELFKNVGLSESMMPDFFERVGRDYAKIENFMVDRINQFKKSIQIIDGTLKSYNSDDSVFSKWTRKGKIKGSKDFTLLYTYDLKTKEPIYGRPYAGNMLDCTIFEDYLENIAKNDELIVGDKGYWNSKIIKKIEEHKKMRYLFPIKRSSKLISANNLMDNLIPLMIKDRNLLGKITNIGNKYYYTIKDLDIEANERKVLFKMSQKKNNFEFQKFNDETINLGTIIFESNSKLSLEDVYTIYSQRWEIEEMFRFYKNILELPKTGVHSEYSLYTTEFINYISLIISMRVKNELTRLNLAEKYSYNQIINYLKSFKKQSSNGVDWRNTKLLNYIEKLAEILAI